METPSDPVVGDTAASNSWKERYVRRILERDRESLKWMWLLVMAFAMETAVADLYPQVMFLLKEWGVFRGITVSVTTDEKIAVYTVLLFLLVFLPTFVRFIYGGNRYIDLRYIEIDIAIGTKERCFLEQEVKQFKRLSSLSDVWLLVGHGLLFLLLAKSMANFQLFGVIYAVLLAVNVFFLTRATGIMNLIFVLQTVREGPDYGEGFFDKLRQVVGLPRRDWPPTWWILNNSITVLLFVGITYWLGCEDCDPSRYFAACLALFAANSLIDFVAAIRFYSPKLKGVIDICEDKHEATR